MGDIGRLLQQVREARGLTQKALADRTGLTVNYLSLVENGHRGLSLQALTSICRELSVAPSVVMAASSEDESADARALREVAAGLLARLIGAAPSGLGRRRRGRPRRRPVETADERPQPAERPRKGPAGVGFSWLPGF